MNREHSIIKIRKLLQEGLGPSSWGPTMREAIALQHQLDALFQTVTTNADAPNILVGIDEYYLDFGFGTTRHLVPAELRLVARVGSRMGLTLRKVGRNEIDLSGIPRETLVIVLAHDEVMSLRLRKLAEAGRLYKFVKT